MLLDLMVKKIAVELIQIERWGTASHGRNSLAAYFCKNRQKKNRKGCHTLTVYGKFISIM